MPDIVKMPAAEWLPDLPAHDNPGATEALNVLPRTVRSYGPLGGLTAYSTTALGARCQGAFSGRSLAGVVTSFAGDATKLYRLVGAAFQNVSAGGFAPYTIAADEHWRFCQMGERVIATDLANPPQSWTLDVSTAFADLSADAPRCRHVAVIEPGFLMCGNLSSAANGVQWSAIDDPTSFPTPGGAAAAAVQAGANATLQGGWVQALIGAVGGAAGAVFMERAIYRLEYVGPPEMFAFREIERARGTPAPNAVVNVGPVAFYLGEDGFYAFDGSRSTPIGASKVDKTFFADLDQTYFHRVYAAADPINKLVVWAYPNAGASHGDPNRLLIHNWETGWWSHAELECELLYRALSHGYSLDALDALGFTLDALPFSLDSRAWSGGRIVLAGFNTAHNLALFTGANLAATVETGEADGGAGRRLFVSGLRPLIDGGIVTPAAGGRDDFAAAPAYGAATGAGADGFCPQRVAARNARARIAVEAGGAWTHLWGVEARVTRQGFR